MQLPSIQKTFYDSNVFLTGGTGFIGSLIMEKLLRSTNVNHIFILIRPKKNKSAEDRLDQLFKEPEFNQLCLNGVNFTKKVILVSGDLRVDGLGISEEDRERLINEIDIVIHCGATVSFVEPLNIALRINMLATQDLLEMATKFRRIKCFCHISTAFSNCNRLSEVIQEKFYDPPVPWIDLLNSMEFLNKMKTEELNELTKALIRDWPNTYTYTKQITENLIKEYKDKFPICIVRPSIVTAAHREPITGFVNNFNTITGALAAVGVGLLRVIFVVPHIAINIMPVDFVVNSTLAAVWDTVNKSERNSKGNKIKIYNSTLNQEEHKLTAKSLMDMSGILRHYRSTKFSIWYPFYILVTNIWIFNILSFLLHVAPVYVGDFILLCMGRKRWILQTYNKKHELIDALKYFCTVHLNFATTNTRKLWNQMTIEDQKLFRFEDQLDLFDYWENYIQGMITYALKDTTSNELNLIRFKKLKALHGASTGILIMIFYYVIKFFIIKIFF